ncbi:unnamed protein product [Lactuca saligna]|uniref:Uncharacterized protein n=1 Tax=Lactuca saligna TaxID=75948 RepID=A0AA35ZTB7_LACSI|nr:unnamed protein product [Lactuca saligna]
MKNTNDSRRQMNNGVRRKHEAAAQHPGPFSSQVTRRIEGRRSLQAANLDVDRKEGGVCGVRRGRRGGREKQRGCCGLGGRNEERNGVSDSMVLDRGFGVAKRLQREGGQKGSDEKYDVAGGGFGGVCSTEEEQMCERWGCCLDGSPKHHHSRWFMTEDEEIGRKSRKKGEEKEEEKVVKKMTNSGVFVGFDVSFDSFN